MRFLRLLPVLVALVAFPALSQQTSENEQPVPEGAGDPESRQELSSGSPQWVAREYLESIRDRGFVATSDFMHPDEMARIKAMLIPVLEAEAEAGGRALMNATFGRDARLTEVKLAGPEEFLRRFARVMSVRMPEQRVDFDNLRVLGSVEEGSLVHVLVRLRWESNARIHDRLEIISLLLFERGWKLILSPKLEAAILAMTPEEQDKRAVPRLIPRPEPPGSGPRPPEPTMPGARRRLSAPPDDEAFPPYRDRY